jgi:hypothetical protein
MKKVFRILLNVLVFVVASYFFTALFLSFYEWIKYDKAFGLFTYLRSYLTNLCKYFLDFSGWYEYYGWSFRIAVTVTLALLLVVNHKRIIIWIKNKKQNSKSNRIERLEDELQNLKKGE